MIPEQKVQLKSVPTGSIDLVFNGMYSRLQFNCGCLDALPYCRAMCCRLRQVVGVELNEAEQLSFPERVQTKAPNGLVVLQSEPGTGNCIYLNEEDQCKVHQAKPEKCKNWHCSPGGVGEDISRRDKGWMLMPSMQV